MTTTDILPDRVYGDWEWDEKTDRPANLYPAKITGSWSGGVEFMTDRATIERIVTAQNALVDASRMKTEDRLYLAGGTLVQDSPSSGERFTYEPDEFGFYHVGFGWSWVRWTDENERAHPDESEAAVAAAVERGKREILEDIDKGIVPAEVRSFDELHDHVDANEYGGLTEADYSHDFVNAVQARLDEWLKQRALRARGDWETRVRDHAALLNAYTADELIAEALVNPAGAGEHLSQEALTNEAAGNQMAADVLWALADSIRS